MDRRSSLFGVHMRCIDMVFFFGRGVYKVGVYTRLNFRS